MSTEIEDVEYYRYYKDLFPHQLIREWITARQGVEHDEIALRREVAYFRPGDVFNRYANIDKFQAEVETSYSQRHEPLLRMEIGPIYSHPCTDREKYQGDFHPEYHEFIIDIDMDDFNEVRSCCQGSNVCPKCWHFMSCALTLLVQMLKNNFGFKCILPCFSGRRGIHIWTCDPRAVKLSADVRKAMVKFMNLSTLDPSELKYQNIEEMFPICEKYFAEFIYHEQALFSKSSGKLGELARSKFPKIYNDICEEIARCQKAGMRPGMETWNQVKNKRIGSTYIRDLPDYKLMIFFFTCPRLDENVTKSMVHLLKSPFSIHPGSGLISVPIPADRVNEFPHNWAPKVKLLLENDPGTVEIFSSSVEILRVFQQKVEALNYSSIEG